MPFHFCHQELAAALMIIPGCALLSVYVKNWIHKHLECHGHHAAHFHRKGGEVSLCDKDDHEYHDFP